MSAAKRDDICDPCLDSPSLHHRGICRLTRRADVRRRHSDTRGSGKVTQESRGGLVPEAQQTALFSGGGAGGGTWTLNFTQSLWVSHPHPDSISGCPVLREVVGSRPFLCHKSHWNQQLQPVLVILGRCCCQTCPGGKREGYYPYTLHTPRQRKICNQHHQGCRRRGEVFNANVYSGVRITFIVQNSVRKKNDLSNCFSITLSSCLSVEWIPDPGQGQDG